MIKCLRYALISVSIYYYINLTKAQKITTLAHAASVFCAFKELGNTAFCNGSNAENRQHGK